MKKKLFLSLTMVLMSLFLITGCKDKKPSSDKPKKPNIPDVNDVELTNNFNIDIFKLSKTGENYLVSPYSIEVALNMLKEGANGETKKQIEDVLAERKVNDVSIKDHINVANAVFVKDDYKKKISDNFSNKLKKNYKAEMIYDKFETPDKINNWVDKQTDGMIKKVIDYISPDFVLGLANAIAIDVEWEDPFECTNTLESDFTDKNGKTLNVEMMNASYTSPSYSYLKNDNATGIIIPYATYNSKTGEVDYSGNRNLEFIGILPNNDIDSYIDNLTIKELNSLFKSAKNASSKYEIRLSLPRFKYSYNVLNFKEILMALGITDAFNYKDADFTNIMDKKDMKENLYVSDAVHKTYIDLNESGTKAAAVTYFGFKDAAAPMEPEDKEVVKIRFNKPFIYIIRDSETKEMLFIGAVYEPNKWTGSTCKEK